MNYTFSVKVNDETRDGVFRLLIGLGILDKAKDYYRSATYIYVRNGLFDGWASGILNGFPENLLIDTTADQNTIVIDGESVTISAESFRALKESLID